MSDVVLHRLRAGSYVTDMAERVGSWAVYRYEDGTRTDGWIVARFEVAEYAAGGHVELRTVEWCPSLSAARALIAHLESV